MPGAHPQTGRIIKLAQAGWTDATIGATVGISTDTVQNVLRTARGNGLDIPKRAATGRNPDRLVIRMSKAARATLQEQALSRSMPMPEFVSYLLNTIVSEDLFDAVLDDDEGDEAIKAPTHITPPKENPNEHPKAN